jgi:hypothetical protein
MPRIRLESGGVAVNLDLEDSATTRALLAALPFEARGNTWGDELYFSTPVSARLEANARQVVEPGTVCFWTQGDALALPWGPTPISTDGKPKLANPCSVLGRVVEIEQLKKIKSGDKIKVTLA